MRIKELFTDDDAVSPVIGVILMVAITVILAAVIASFVLGLGQQTNTQPAASFGFDYDQGENVTVPPGQTAANLSGGSATPLNDGAIAITHQSGDNIKSEELKIKGEDVATGTWAYNAGTTQADQLGGDASGTIGSGNSAVTAGDSVTVEANSSYTVRVVYEPAGQGDSAQLSSDTGPDA